MKYQIYKITNLLEPQRVYIGMTSKPLKRRFQYHYNSKRGALYNVMNEVGKDNFSIEKIDCSETKTDGLIKEEFWTLFYMDNGYILYNIDIANKHSESTRKKISEKAKGRKPSTETLEKYSKRMMGNQFNKGRLFSEEWRRHIGESHKGKKHSQETIQKLIDSNRNNPKQHCKKVQCIETGEIFPSISEAARRNNIILQNLSHVCNGKAKTAGGYHWKFVQ